MKILIIGFIAFLGWGALSVHLYVCKIRGLCDEPISMQKELVINNTIIDDDTLSKPLSPAQTKIPGTLSIFFDFDKSEFKPDDMTDRYIVESNAFLNQNTLSSLIITGHTDAIGTDEYNQSLGYRRAQSLQNYFESKGMPANKIIIESKGEKEPADDNRTSAGRANNRRALVTIKK
jgi:outer membrane protein OmpA-like peptidoglycan-associated protein